MNGIERIRSCFATASGEHRVLLIAYLMAGHPDVSSSVAAAAAVLDAGADMLEIGVPFSDPLADGPVIAAAGRGVIERGGGLDTARELARGLRSAGRGEPLLLMTYRNPLTTIPDADVAMLAHDGIDGVIIPDLPVNEEPALETALRRAGIAQTNLIAPNTSDARLRTIARNTSGFVYVVPRYGVTGGGPAGDDAGALLRRVRAAVGPIPIAAGFGISTTRHVRELAPHVDAVIVGTALVRAVGDRGPTAAGRLAAALAGAARAH